VALDPEILERDELPFRLLPREELAHALDSKLEASCRHQEIVLTHPDGLSLPQPEGPELRLPGEISSRGLMHEYGKAA